MEGEWISVEDSMPNIGYDVLAHSKNGRVSVERCYNDGTWNPVFAYGWNKGQEYEVTHWMPLPEKPKK